LSKIINLNRERKDRAKSRKKQQAAENRIRFGQTSNEKKLIEKRRKLASKQLDNHKKTKD